MKDATIASFGNHEFNHFAIELVISFRMCFILIAYCISCILSLKFK